MSMAQDSDEVYVCALCKGDSTPEIGTSSVETVSKVIRTNYPEQKEAYTWTDSDTPCLVHYAVMRFLVYCKHNLNQNSIMLVSSRLI